tara:strand:+ start:10607 stop:11764 length:1158 start_codon:yes stop_codon:yes gene_type:complete
MPRKTGTFRTIKHLEEEVKAFVPNPLPPADPPLKIDETITKLHMDALLALARLDVAGKMVPDTDWFLYGFVRKEAVITSQIEGTQATLGDVLEFEATEQTDRPDDVEEICNYIEAITYARKQLAKPTGLPLGVELLCKTHRILMRGTRGKDKRPGKMRTTQNWIGGTKPGNAIFVPPPPDEVGDALRSLETRLHMDETLPPLIQAGLAHVQFETIHPFLDGNGRIGRLLITLLVEHWGLLDQPLLYISLAFKRDQLGYYEQLSAVRRLGDWEGWTRFFLNAVREAADDGVRIAQELHALIGKDRDRIIGHERSTVAAIQLLDMLPASPVTTISVVCDTLHVTAPTARKAVELLESLNILHETSGKQRDRVYAYSEYMRILTGNDE